MSSTSIPSRARAAGGARARALPDALRGLRAHPEVLGLVVLAAALNLWDLSRNGWANTFYAGAVRSMASSWHDFLFASLDKTGLMTVDKPPAAFWVQALSARIFGFHPLSILVPQALMGVAAVVFAYDLTRRMFGRGAAAAAGIAFALTPITVAMARHNNPDELLILSCVAAMWCAVRALQDGRTKWLVWCGALVGLGFETKMAVALFVVPGIFLAYLWTAPAGRGHWHALRQLLWGGLALAVVGLAWPLLVMFTPAADRPWISGTSDNSIWSLIVGYNGVGRVDGQAGGTGGASGGFGGGAVGIFRLLDSGLGGQAGWLLGFALVAGVGILAVTRMRRTDPRTGWVLAVGGAAFVSALVFSFASGIFHPYYVSFLAPWVAMLVGAGVGTALSSSRSGVIVGALSIAGGAVSELVILGEIDGSVSWARPLVIVVCALAVIALALRISPRVRGIVVAVAIAALLAAPAAWAVDTLGHATSSTFPAGGPESASMGGFGGPGSRGGFSMRGGSGSRGGFRFGGASGSRGGPFGASGSGSSSRGGFGSHGGSSAPPGSGSGSRGGFGSHAGAPPGASITGHFSFRGGAGQTSGSRSGAAGGGMFGGDTTSLTAASKYASSHGGGTVAVESQSSAAAAILAGETNVAGIGGFSGRESTVSAKWLAMEVRDGKLRWLLKESTTTGGPGGFASGGSASGGFSRGGASSASGSRTPPSFGSGGSSSGGAPSAPGGSARSGSAHGFGGRRGPGGAGADGRDGSEKAIAIAEKVGRRVTFTYHGTKVTMYDLEGKAAAILAAAAK